MTPSSATITIDKELRGVCDGGGVVGGGASVVAAMSLCQMSHGKNGGVSVEPLHSCTRDTLSRNSVLGPFDKEGLVPPVDGTLDGQSLPEGQVATEAEDAQLRGNCVWWWPWHLELHSTLIRIYIYTQTSGYKCTHNLHTLQGLNTHTYKYTNI